MSRTETNMLTENRTNATVARATRGERSEDWPVTRVMEDDIDEPTQEATRTPSIEPDAAHRDVGRQSVPNEHELFVSCDPAPALQQQFEFLRPVFIAVHDIATMSSRKLLLGVAAASGRTLQRLVIRRQGYGTALATLHFVELQTNEGPRLRMYTTDCETEPAWRADIASLLLGFSRLGVVMVGQLQPQAIANALRPLRERIVSGPWPNRQLLLLPLTSANTLVSHGMELARGTPVNVRTTPQVARPADAWGFISGSWTRANAKTDEEANAAVGLSPLFSSGRLAPASAQRRPDAASLEAERADAAETAPGVLKVAAVVQPRRNDSSSAAAQPLPAQPPPAAAAGARVAAAVPQDIELLRRYVRQLSEIAGMGSCCVFDLTNGDSVAYAGEGAGAPTLARLGAELRSTLSRQGRTLHLGANVTEASATFGTNHVLLRSVPKHPAFGMIAVLDQDAPNLTMVRLQVLRLDTLFEDAGQ